MAEGGKELKFDFESVLGIARLRLDDKEKEQIITQLKEIFRHFSEIQKLNLKEQENETVSGEFIAREDIMEKSTNQDKIVELFCNKKDRHLEAPKTIE